MLKKVAVAAVFMACSAIVSGQPNKGTDSKHDPTQNSNPATVLASPAESYNGAHDTEKSDKDTGNWYDSLKRPDWWIVIVAGITGGFIGWQAILTRHSIDASEKASKIELRAYIHAAIGDAVFQQRRSDEDGGDLMFECRPLLVNSGQTPAKNIQFKARAAVLQTPLSRDTRLPEDHDVNVGGSFLAAKADGNMTAPVDGFQPDKEVDDIKMGFGAKALFTWGLITYEDVFGDKHYTRFCHHIYWDRKGNVRGHHMPGRNDAD